MFDNAKRLFLLYLLLTPYYFFASGGLQISTAFLVLSALLFLLASALSIKGKNELSKIFSENRHLTFFILATLVVNGYYYLTLGGFKFLLSSIYFIFNLLIVITFSGFYRDKRFLKNMLKIFKFNIFVQIIIFAVGAGRFYGVERYMGTFNDPNQMGFYIFMSLMFIFVLNGYLEKSRKSILVWMAGLFLIVQSASTGMLLGVAVFFFLLAIYYFRVTYSLVRKAAYIATFTLIAAVSIFWIATTIVRSQSQGYLASPMDSFVVKRLNEKAEKAEGGENLSLWEDRRYDMIYKYPQYVLFGAGEGVYSRFKVAAGTGEIHATLPSILFYYGIIPFVFLGRWVYLKLRNADRRVLIVCGAVFVESFTLLNQRQPLFWMVIVLGGLFVTSVKMPHTSIQRRLHA